MTRRGAADDGFFDGAAAAALAGTIGEDDFFLPFWAGCSI
jgi:hypothetical protein